MAEVKRYMREHECDVAVAIKAVLNIRVPMADLESL